MPPRRQCRYAARTSLSKLFANSFSTERPQYLLVYIYTTHRVNIHKKTFLHDTFIPVANPTQSKLGRTLLVDRCTVINSNKRGSRAEQSRAEQSRAEQSRAEQRWISMLYLWMNRMSEEMHVVLGQDFESRQSCWRKPWVLKVRDRIMWIQSCVLWINWCEQTISPTPNPKLAETTY